VAKDGGSIEVELWSLPSDKVGTFLRNIPPPLGLGTVVLEDGSSTTGFLCEGHASSGARDITELGGWRAYLKSRAAP
jgi:allophanate hydrolase